MRHLYSVFDKTTNLCFYKFNGSYRITGLFPNVTILTLINCTQIQSILQPSVFPNLRKINYLSSAPIEPIQSKLETKWVFPSGNHVFYRCMIEAGVGQVDHELVPTYIDSMKRAEDGLTDITLYIPDYGLINGENYEYYLTSYLTKNKSNPNPFQEYYNRNLTKSFLEMINAS